MERAIIEKEKAPGLEWKNGKPRWRATKQAIASGYVPKNVQLPNLSGDALIKRCNRLQQEMIEWLNGDTTREIKYDGTFGTLIGIWETHEESDFHKLKRKGKHGTHPYDSYIPVLKASIGKLRVKNSNGLDLKRWFKAWQARPNGKTTLAAARTTLAILKASVTFGVLMTLPGCTEFDLVLKKAKFPGLKRRKTVVKAEEVIEARQCAHDIDHPRLALCYALQYETLIRQYDIAGVWRPLDYPGIGPVDNDAKWIGPTWANISKDLILTITPSKTEENEEAPEDVQWDLKACPMVMEEISRIPVEERVGPIIVNQKTGLPYNEWVFGATWREIANLAGLPKTYQNRDLRASGITEAEKSGARLQDTSRTATHADEETTRRFYVRDNLEAHRRVQASRVAWRNKDETSGT